MGLMEKLESYSAPSKIFKSKLPLTDNYIPDHLLFRDKEMDEITRAVAPLLRGEIGFDVFLFGPPGAGKTHAVKLLQREFNALAEKKGYPARAIYISARDKTLSKTWSDLYLQASTILTGEPEDPPKWMSTSIDKFISLVNETPYEGILLIVDEIDKMIASKSKEPTTTLISQLTRLDEKGLQKQLNIILVSNERKRILDKLDESTKSKFRPKEVFFRDYNANEIKAILEARAEEAFREGVLEVDVIPYVAAIVRRENKDLRYGFYILLEAGEFAEAHRLTKVTVQVVDTILEPARQKLIRDRILSLDGLEKVAFLSILLTTEFRGGGPYEEVAPARKAYNTMIYILRSLGSKDARITYDYFRKFLIRSLRAKELIDIIRPGKGGRVSSVQLAPLETGFTTLKILIEETAASYYVSIHELLKSIGSIESIRKNEQWGELLSQLGGD